MEDWCSKCEVMQDFLPVGNCPVCGAKNLMMKNATSMAFCEQCGERFGIPKGRSCLCSDDLFNKKYTVNLLEKPKKESLLRISKIIGRNVTEIHKITQEEVPQFHGLTFFQAFDLIRLFSESQLKNTCVPSLKNYTQFETCWRDPPRDDE